MSMDASDFRAAECHVCYHDVVLLADYRRCGECGRVVHVECMVESETRDAVVCRTCHAEERESVADWPPEPIDYDAPDKLIEQHAEAEAAVARGQAILNRPIPVMRLDLVRVYEPTLRYCDNCDRRRYDVMVGDEGQFCGPCRRPSWMKPDPHVCPTHGGDLGDCPGCGLPPSDDGAESESEMVAG